MTEGQKRYVNKRNNLVKSHFILQKGGKCSICGGVFLGCCYDFHHLIPSKKLKDFKWNWGSKQSKLQSEINKCILICANCHRKLHWLRESINPKGLR